MAHTRPPHDLHQHFTLEEFLPQMDRNVSTEEVISMFKWLVQLFCKHPTGHCMSKPGDPSKIICLDCWKEFKIEEDRK